MKNLLAIITLLTLSSLNLFAQWQSDLRLTNDSAYSSTIYNSAECIGSSGDSVHVVWYDQRDGNSEIYYKRSTDGGSIWGADNRLTIDNASSWNTSLAVLGSVVHVVWIEDRDGNWEIYYKHSTDGGTNWGADTRLTNNSSFSEFPSISVSGSVVSVVWMDNRDGNYEIYYKQSSDGGASWSADTRLTSNSAFSSTPSVSVSGLVVHVIWRDFRDGNYEIYYKHSTDGGTNWQPDTRLTDNFADSGDPSVSASGSVVNVVWMDNRDGYHDIYYKGSTDGGSNWQQDIKITYNLAGPGSPSVSASGLVVHVVWQDFRDGDWEIYYKRSTDSGTSWGGDTRLTNNSSYSELPSVSVSGSAVHVLWSDNRDGNLEIYYKRNPNGNVTGIENINSELPTAFELSQNYPNPFNPVTTIQYSIPQRSNVTLKVYDVLGKEIAVLVNEEKDRGVYTAGFDGTGLASGMYLYRLKAGSFVETKKMILLR